MRMKIYDDEEKEPSEKPESPTLLSVTAIYAQDADGDQDNGQDQELKLSMMTCGGAPYLVIETQRWDIDRPKELNHLVKQFAAQVEFLFDAHSAV